MKDILTIIFRLTLSCIIAATVMGTTFVITNKAKKHNEHVKEEKVAYSLLGFDDEKPDSIALETIYRYVVKRAGKQFIGYLLPQEDGFSFLQIDLNGKIAAKNAITLDEENALEAEEREKAILAVIGEENGLRYADQTKIVTENGKRAAYLISGKFPGFKTHIAVMMALRPDFSIIGFEVMEHEEDPGLGAEIEQNYFKNQFKGKSFERLKELEVVKEPIPPKYLEALELRLAAEEQKTVLNEYRDNDIYALTGATISTVSVTDGLKGLVKKFVYRINVLDAVMANADMTASL